MRIEKWKIEQLFIWDKNPRGIKEDDFARLGEQMKLGQYKPLLINDGTKWGKKGIALGGNMRLRWYQQNKVKEVWVSLVSPKDESHALEYALSDNDRAGYYEEDKLAEMLFSYKDFPLDTYKVDLGYQADLHTVMGKYGTTHEVEQLENTINTGQLDGWLKNTIKQIVLHYAGEDFANVVNSLQKVIDDNALRNNTEAVTYLIAYYENNHTTKKKIKT